MCVIRKDLLNKIDNVNKALQEPGIEFCTVIKLYDSLITDFHVKRNNLEMFDTIHLQRNYTAEKSANII